MNHLADALRRHWGRDPSGVEAAPGHSNASFFVACGDEALVLRRSWPHKPAARIAEEEAILAHLARAAPDLPVPRLVATVDGALHARDAASALHLFRRLPGAPPPSWRGPISRAQMGSALGLLARLHRALAALPVAGDADPLGPMVRRRAAVDAAAPGLDALPSIARDLPRFLERVDRLLDQARALPLGKPQWIHGDFHLGNLLLDGERVSGIVDFDDAGVAAAEIDLAFAGFALARDGARDDRFVFDPALIDAGLAAYGAARLPSENVPFLARLFCAHQALLHIDAAARGLWRLAPGIGFLPCFRAVLS